MHDLVDTPRSFITRILKAEEEMEKCQRLWAAMPQNQMDDERDPYRNHLDSEYNKFINEIKTLGLAGIAEVMKYQKEVQSNSTAIRELSRDIPSNEWLPCANAYCVFKEVYYDVLKMQRKQYYHFSNDECRDLTSWSKFLAH